MTDGESDGAQGRSVGAGILSWLPGIAAGLLGSAMVAVLVLPSVMPRVFRTDCSKHKARADIQTIAWAAEQYALEHEGAFPSSLLDLVTPDENGFSYLRTETVPRDRWGREYLYFPPGVFGPEAVVCTLGSDAAPGGKGEAQDLDNLALRSGKL